MTEKEMQMMRDVVIGEAALAILNDNTRVSWPGILNKLNKFLKHESNEFKIQALKIAINDVSEEIKRRTASQATIIAARTENISDNYDDQTWH